ncbi:carbohydrate ABC transporter permease [Paenibacillus lignilyticus]|uniref:Carbohydrate ABC transporter permease n=1 Tax=Paenibacillus lignilyticus TaxID=1172615 RepID=A0ABS5CBZ1_9BACL|nr:carbohydrate ABC transporter permease [Paenibacillus lignilyticus]MBP3962668.1 carbohydrate ABC transporter permease [Paenibacillus lignilyticus]
MVRKYWGQISLNVIIAGAVLLSVYPLSILLFGFSKDTLTWEYNKWLPVLPLWFNNVNYAWSTIHVAFWNTVFVGAISAAGGVFLSSLGGFVFARLKFYGKEIIFYFIIALMMIPGILGLVPWYLLVKELGMLNSLWGLIWPNIFGTPIFGIFLLRGFFAAIPEDLFEAAKMDGCGTFKLYYKIAVPVSVSILATLAVMQIVGVWNDLIGPSIILTDPDKYVITLALRNFSAQVISGEDATNYPALFSAYILASLPLILLFMFASKYYVEGLTSSGLKL